MTDQRWPASSGLDQAVGGRLGSTLGTWLASVGLRVLDCDAMLEAPSAKPIGRAGTFHSHNTRPMADQRWPASSGLDQARSRGSYSERGANQTLRNSTRTVLFSVGLGAPRQGRFCQNLREWVLLGEKQMENRRAVPVIGVRKYQLSPTLVSTSTESGLE